MAVHRNQHSYLDRVKEHLAEEAKKMSSDRDVEQPSRGETDAYPPRHPDYQPEPTEPDTPTVAGQDESASSWTLTSSSPSSATFQQPTSTTVNQATIFNRPPFNVDWVGSRADGREVQQDHVHSPHQVSLPDKKGKTYQEYRQNRVDRISGLLRARYRRVVNEANSHLLVDQRTGEVVPERVEAIASPIEADYRTHYQTEAQSADIKRAFSHLTTQVQPWSAQVFCGRAGYDPASQQRYIDVGPGGPCLTFQPGAEQYSILNAQPFIRPTQSLPLYSSDLAHPKPDLVNTLFHWTALPTDSDLLLIAWMVLAWMPDRQTVMLELLGRPSATLEHAHTLIKQVVDPATEPWQNALPGNSKQLHELAFKHYLLSFNRVESLTPTQQNHLFNLMRGQQVDWIWKGKKVDAQITVQRPVLLNSSESVATVPKLADATLSIEVEEDSNRPATHPTSIAPEITSGLLQVFGYIQAHFTAQHYATRLDRYGGLADLCRVGELVAKALQRDTADFWVQFNANQRARREYELEESPVAMAVIRAVETAPEGVVHIKVKEWLALLENYRPKDSAPEHWPNSSRGLAAKFKDAQALLSDMGIALTATGQRGPHRYWRAEKIESRPSESQIEDGV